MHEGRAPSADFTPAFAATTRSYSLVACPDGGAQRVASIKGSFQDPEKFFARDNLRELGKHHLPTATRESTRKKTGL